MKNLKRFRILAAVVFSIIFISCGNTEKSITIKGTGGSMEFVLDRDTMFVVDSKFGVDYTFIKNKNNKISLEGNGFPLYFVGDGQVISLSDSQKGVKYELLTVTDVEDKLKEYLLTPLVDQYRAGEAGGSLGLIESSLGVTYELYNLGYPTGYQAKGTGAGIVWKNLPMGTYTCLATDNKTGISKLMKGELSIIEAN